MKNTLFLAVALLCQVNICYSQGLLGNFQDFFEFNGPVSTGDNTGFPSDTGFPDDTGFPPGAGGSPDTGFPPSAGGPPDTGFPPGAGGPPDTGFPPGTGGSPDTGVPLETGFPPNNGFPPGPGSAVDSGFPADMSPGSGSSLNNASPKTGSNTNAPDGTGLPSGTGSAITNNKPTLQGELPPFDFGVPGGQLPAQPMPFDTGLPAQPLPVNSNMAGSFDMGGFPADPADVGFGGMPAQPLPVGPGFTDNTGFGGLPATTVDIVSGGLPAQPANVGDTKFPPFDVVSTDPQAGSNQGPVDTQEPFQLDFHFLPQIPRGGNFTNLVTGNTNTFEPSFGWLGNPGNPVDIELNGPGMIDQPLDAAPVDTGIPSNVPFVDFNAVNVPVPDTFIPLDNQQNPVIAPVEPWNPIVPANPFDTKAPVHVDPIFVDPLAPFVDPSQAVDQGAIQGQDQNVLLGTQNSFGPLGGGNTGIIEPSPGTGQVINIHDPWATKPGIFSVFDLSSNTDPSQSLGSGKPAAFPFDTLGPANPTKQTEVPTKNNVPGSWMQLYPSGRRPKRPVLAATPTPVDNVNQETPTDRILYDLSLGSFGRNRDLQKQLRAQRKQTRQRRRQQRQQRRQQKRLQQQRPQQRQNNRQMSRANPRSSGGRVARLRIPVQTGHRHARMVLPGTRRPFIGKRGRRGKRNVLVCNEIERLAGLCQDGMGPIPEVQHNIGAKGTAVNRKKARKAMRKQRNRQRSGARGRPMSNKAAKLQPVDLSQHGQNGAGQGVGPADLDIGPMDLGFGPMDMGIGQIDMGIGQIDMGIGPLDMGIGQIDMGIGTSNSGIGQADMVGGSTRGTLAKMQRKPKRVRKNKKSKRPWKGRARQANPKQAMQLQNVDLSQMQGQGNIIQGINEMPFVSSKNVFMNPTFTPEFPGIMPGGISAIQMPEPANISPPDAGAPNYDGRQPVLNQASQSTSVDVPFLGQNPVDQFVSPVVDQHVSLGPNVVPQGQGNMIQGIHEHGSMPFVSSKNVFMDPTFTPELPGQMLGGKSAIPMPEPLTISPPGKLTNGQPFVDQSILINSVDPSNQIGQDLGPFMVQQPGHINVVDASLSQTTGIAEPLQISNKMAQDSIGPSRQFKQRRNRLNRNRRRRIQRLKRLKKRKNRGNRKQGRGRPVRNMQNVDLGTGMELPPLPEVEPTPAPELDCSSGFCIDWSWEGKKK